MPNPEIKDSTSEKQEFWTKNKLWFLIFVISATFIFFLYRAKINWSKFGWVLIVGVLAMLIYGVLTIFKDKMFLYKDVNKIVRDIVDKEQLRSIFLDNSSVNVDVQEIGKFKYSVFFRREARRFTYDLRFGISEVDSRSNYHIRNDVKDNILVKAIQEGKINVQPHQEELP